MLKQLVVGALCAGLMACGGSETSPEQSDPSNLAGRQVVSVAKLMAQSPDGQVVVDMRNTELGFHVEKGLNHSAITVICPSSRVMNLEKWLPELASELQTSPAQLQKGFTMYPFMAPAPGTVAQQSAPECTSPDPYTTCEAEREPDGSWTCMCYSV